MQNITIIVKLNWMDRQISQYTQHILIGQNVI
jgi:hypothetical protein